MENGWIKLHRKLLENQIFENEKCLKIWVWCLLKANHSPNTFLMGRQKLSVNKGQFIMGGIKAEEILNIARTTIYYWLDFLAKEGMIDIKKTNKYTIITIKNWDKHQAIDIKKTSNDTTNGHQKDTNNNDKNEKNEKKILQTEVCEVIPDLLKDNKKHIRIIGLYVLAKQVVFKNKETQNSFIRRNLRAAQNLTGYDSQKIIDTMKYLIDNADFKWTLESVGKFIDEDLINLKAKATSESDYLNNLKDMASKI